MLRGMVHTAATKQNISLIELILCVINVEQEQTDGLTFPTAISGDANKIVTNVKVHHNLPMLSVLE